MSGYDALNERLSFIELDAAAQADIRAAKATVMEALPSALDAFYQKVGSVPATRKFFSGPDHMRGAKSRQLSHWESISSAKFDSDYVDAVTRVGEVHARIGLEPRWYIGGYALLLEQLMGALLEKHWPKRFGRKAPGAAQARREMGAIAKATLLDMDYAISVYIEASERERLKAEAVREAAAKEQSEVVAALAQALGQLRDGDLTGAIPNAFPGDYEQLRADFNSALDALGDTMSQVLNATRGIGTGTDEISQASDDLSRRTEQQAASLEETAAALDQITATVKKTAEGARQASGTVTRAKEEAVHSGEVVAKAVDAMGQIEKSSQQISQIIGVIDEIAFQTNLLALNAGVEAARAGDAGKGFAVVASEVRALAQRSAEAAKEIKALISASSNQVEQGVNLVGDTGKALRQIVEQVSQIDGLVSEIAASAQEQATGLAEVNTAVNQMDQVVQQNAAMVEEATAATHSLKGETSELVRLVTRFRVGQSHAAAAPVAAPPPRHAAARAAPRVIGATALKSTDNDGWSEF